MSKGFKDKDGKFHPINNTKGVRMSRSQNAKQQGVKIKPRKQRQVMASEVSGLSQVKKEMMNGRPVTSVRFANGEEWFEFDDIRHQEDFMKEEKIQVDETVVGEFVEIEHPDIAGYITMATGKVLFGEREEKMKNDGIRMKRGAYDVGDIVMVSPDNDNEGYDSFRGKKLRIVNKTTSSDEHPAFDEGMAGEGLYDLETLDGELVGSALYDYELVNA